MVSPYAPATVADHAGAALLERYASAMSRHFEVVVLTGENVAQMSASVPVHHLDVRKSRVPNVPLSRAIPDVVLGVPRPEGFVRALRADQKAQQLLREADVVELHFGQYMPLLRLPALGYKARGIVLHDVLSQSMSRLARTLPERKQRWRMAARLPAVRRQELVVLRHADQIITLSEKDRRLLPRAVQAKTAVLQPLPEVQPPLVRRRGPSQPVALILGAMWRPENYLGALWFVSRVWPAVARSVPGAKLRIVGARPPDTLRAVADHDVEVVGWVASYEEELASAKCMVAPLLQGAGVKLKVLQAFAQGVPVVATPIAAEGIADSATEGAFVVITDEPARMARALVNTLLGGKDAHLAAAVAMRWLTEQPSWEQQVHKIAVTYLGLTERT